MIKKGFNLDVFNLKCLQDVQAEKGQYVGGGRSLELRGGIKREGINSLSAFGLNLKELMPCLKERP